MDPADAIEKHARYIASEARGGVGGAAEIRPRDARLNSVDVPMQYNAEELSNSAYKEVAELHRLVANLSHLLIGSPAEIPPPLMAQADGMLNRIGAKAQSIIDTVHVSQTIISALIQRAENEITF